MISQDLQTKKRIAEIAIIILVMIGLITITVIAVNNFLAKTPNSPALQGIVGNNIFLLQEQADQLTAFIYLIVFIILFITSAFTWLLLRNRIWLKTMTNPCWRLLKYYSWFIAIKLYPLTSIKNKTKKIKHLQQQYPLINNLSLFQQGSALIITLLVITVVSAMIFSTGTLALKELKLTTQLEESDQAYYAAESGIEVGLLAFRFSREFETSENATKEEVEPIRFDLTDTDTSSASEKSVFDLKSFYRSDENFICVPENSCDKEGIIDITFTSDTPALAKDQTVEYDLSGVSSGSLTIEWVYDEIITGVLTTQTKLEYTVYDKDGQIDNSGKNKDVFDYKYSGGRPITFSNNAKILRLKSWGANIANYTISGGSADKLDTKYTNIESTGYYGGTKRKLQITLDRTTGTLLGLHDFALFGSSNITVPTP